MQPDRLRLPKWGLLNFYFRVKGWEGISSFKIIMDWIFSQDWWLSLQCGWIGLHFLGLAAAWMVRVHAGTKSEGSAQLLFLASFCSLVLATVVGLGYSSTNWTSSAATLAIMIVAAVVDFSSQNDQSVNFELVSHRN